jgi:hypothetical protein
VALKFLLSPSTPSALDQGGVVNTGGLDPGGKGELPYLRRLNPS